MHMDARYIRSCLSLTRITLSLFNAVACAASTYTVGLSSSRQQHRLQVEVATTVTVTPILLLLLLHAKPAEQKLRTLLQLKQQQHLLMQ